jgi:aquaporin NIP
MNPARSLGPALLAGVAEAQWLYVLGPVLGAVAGAWTYDVIACGRADNSASGCC